MLSKNRYKDCYQKSLKVRRIIAEQFEALTKEYDAVLTPAISTLSVAPYDISEAFAKVFSEGEFVSLANLIGVPALVSGGVQLTGKAFSESTLLSLAKVTERKG
jgi:aspartyl-tRNA(Asn)/glutamyl-tRNA(Gln) amidotransferase subunit A